MPTSAQSRVVSIGDFLKIDYIGDENVSSISLSSPFIKILIESVDENNNRRMHNIDILARAGEPKTRPVSIQLKHTWQPWVECKAVQYY